MTVEAHPNGQSSIVAEQNFPRDGFVNEFFEEVKRREQESQPVSLRTHVERVIKGEKPHYKNAYDVLGKAISALPAVTLPSGRLRYSFYSDREDDKRVCGQYRVIETFVDYVNACRESGGEDQIVVFVGPTGAGKSLIVDASKRGLKEYSEKTKDIYAVEGCPAHDDPMTAVNFLASPELKQRLSRDCGISVGSELCADCQAKGHALTEKNVVPVVFSSGLGIVKLEPKHTKSEKPGSPKITSMILSANRGILEIAEFCKHDGFLDTINDLASGRTFIDEQGREIKVDMMIFGHTTRKEWEKFSKDERFESLRERVKVIEVPYNLSRSDEASIYEDKLRKSKTPFYSDRREAEENADGKAKHISDKTLGVLAEVGIRSRLKESGRPGLTIDKKVELYDGKTVEGFDQSQVKEIEDEGAVKDEGMSGLSPRFMIGSLREIAEQVEGCLNPVRALAEFEKGIVNTSNLGQKEEIRRHIASVRNNFEEWLKGRVRQAFRANFERDAKKLFVEYIRNAELDNSGGLGGIYNPALGEVEVANTLLLMEIEDRFDNVRQTDAQRKEKRREVLQKIKSMDDMNAIPWLKTAIERALLGLSKSPDELLIANSLNSKDLKPEDADKLKEVTQRLIDESGFCPHCARDLIKHVGTNLRQKSK